MFNPMPQGGYFANRQPITMSQIPRQQMQQQPQQMPQQNQQGLQQLTGAAGSATMLDPTTGRPTSWSTGQNGLGNQSQGGLQPLQNSMRTAPQMVDPNNLNFSSGPLRPPGYGQQQPMTMMQNAQMQQNPMQPRMLPPQQTYQQPLQPQTPTQQSIAQQQNMYRQQATVQQMAQTQPGNTMMMGSPNPVAPTNQQAASNLTADQQAYLNRYMQPFKGSPEARQQFLSANQDRLLSDYATANQINTQRQNTQGGLAYQYLESNNPQLARSISNNGAGALQQWLNANPDQAAKFQQQANQYKTANQGNWVNDPGQQ